MDRATKVRNWAVAVAAVIGTGWMIAEPGAHFVDSFVREVVAQEAAKQMAPATAELSSIKGLMRRKEDRELTAECLKNKTELRCTQESELRWRVYDWEDDGKVGPKPELR